MKEFQHKFMQANDSGNISRGLEWHTDMAECVEFGTLTKYTVDATVIFAYGADGEIVDTVLDDWKVYDVDGEHVNWTTLHESELWAMFHVAVEACEDSLPSQSDRAFDFKCAGEDYEANADYN